MPEQKNKAAQALGKLRQKKRTEGMTKEQISAMYREMSHKRKIFTEKKEE